MALVLTERMQAVSDICDSITRKIDRAYVAGCGRNHERPEKLWQIWADTGLLGIGLPEQYGGIEGTLIESVLAHDLTHRAGLVMSSAVTTIMAQGSLVKHGTEEQKQRYLPSTATGETFFSAGITEADSGTNLFKLRSFAKRDANGDFVLNGEKVYQTGFMDADYALVVCRTTPFDPANRYGGLSMLIVDTRSTGISSTVMDIQINWPDKHYVVSFDDVVVPAANLLGEEGNATGILFGWLNPERLLGTATALGMADHVLARAAEYAKVRAPFKGPIGAYQSIQHPMAAAKANIEAARCMLYETVARFDAGEDVGLETNMVKYLSSTAFKLATDIAMTTFGGASVDLSQDILPFYLAAKLQEVAPVNNNIVLSFIAEKALGLPKSY